MEIAQEVLKIVLGGVSTSICILLLARHGFLPILYLSPNPLPEPKEEDKE